MFDRHIHMPRMPDEIRVTQHEHRAPTDESVRLLNEMEEKVEARLLAVTELRSNIINATWHTFDEPERLGTRTVLRFTINEGKVQLELQHGRGLTKREEFERVRDAIAKRIAEEFAIDLFMSAERREAYLRGPL
jgi:hypothetical protein